MPASPNPQQAAQPGATLFAVLSDIHGNYAALRAVAADADRLARQEHLPAPRYILLGDFVDYGPQPNECMNWLERNRSRIALLLRGNHDAEMAQPDWRKPERVGSRWWPITMWTRLHLARRHRRTLAELAEVADGPGGLEDFICCHSTPWARQIHHAYRNMSAPPDGYIGESVAPEQVLVELGQAHMHGLFGHTHHQVLFVKNGGKAAAHYAQPDGRLEDVHDRAVNRWYDFPDAYSAIINPGSVGQPRLHAWQKGVELGGNDPRAAYLLLLRRQEQGAVTTAYQWRRVAYPAEQTAVRLRRLAWRAKDQQPLTAAGNDFTQVEWADLQQALPGVTAELAKQFGAAVAATE